MTESRPWGAAKEKPKEEGWRNIAIRAGTSWRCSARAPGELAATGSGLWLEEGGPDDIGGQTADPGGGACATAN
jgi:hypothetical protein